jgi:DNA-binding LacI/PurR family transcriptional regulator
MSTSCTGTRRLSIRIKILQNTCNKSELSVYIHAEGSMVTTRRARGTLEGGRGVTDLAGRLRERIRNGAFVGGSFLPTERQLAAEHGVAKMTARRALKALEREGLVVAQPRQGYRVLMGGGDPDRGLPVAYVVHRPDVQDSSWDDFHSTLLSQFQRVAAEKGWSLLVVESHPDDVDGVTAQLSSSGVCGAILDLGGSKLERRLREGGLPTVGVDMSSEKPTGDLVVQDGFMGGVLAASHLAARGHKRVAWLGPDPVGGDLQILERYCGAVGGLERAGIPLDPSLCIRLPEGQRELAARKAEELLSRKDRPTAVLALWQGMSVALGAAARKLGLCIGKDLEMVGWSTEEEYESGFLPGFSSGDVPAAVVWSVARMAEAAVRCIKARRAEPGMLPLHLRIPTSLRLGLR